MKAFTYERAPTSAQAAAAAARSKGAKFIACGTNLLDLMKLEIETPAHLIDVNGLGLDKVEATPEGGLRGGPHPQSQISAESGDRRDDDGSRCGFDGGARGRQAPGHGGGVVRL